MMLLCEEARKIIFPLLLLLRWVQPAGANVEKIIFRAPASSTLPQDASIDNLLLMSLNPDHLTVRTYLNASFPTNEKPHGQDMWALLEGLTPGQRYELRICWLATQPTAFWIHTHSLTSVFETPDLITSLSTYAYARHEQLDESEINDLQKRRFVQFGAKETSVLLLQVQAAADYFSLNKTLMEQVPSVHVDLILDPYLLNVLPESLIPTAIYIVLVAIFAWGLSSWAYRRMVAFIVSTDQLAGDEDKKVR